MTPNEVRGNRQDVHMVEKRSKKKIKKERREVDSRKEGSQSGRLPAGRTICSREHQDLGLVTVSTLAMSVSDS